MREEDRINKLEVGTWTTSVGLLLKDDLFPHVTGVFRGRVITVASIQVKLNIFINNRLIKNSFDFTTC